MEPRRTISPLLWIGILLVLSLVAWSTLHLGDVWLGVAVAGCGVLLPYLFAAWSFHRMIPRTVVLLPLDENRVCPKFAGAVRKLEEVGFRLAAGPLAYNSRPPSQLALLRHDLDPVYAAVLRVRVFGTRKVHYSFLSPLVGGGHLESTATPELEAVSAPPFVRLQVIANAEPAELLEHHRLAIARTRERGERFQVPIASELQREAFFSLAETGEYLRGRAYRLALEVFCYALNHRNRNPRLFEPGD